LYLTVTLSPEKRASAGCLVNIGISSHQHRYPDSRRVPEKGYSAGKQKNIIEVTQPFTNSILSILPGLFKKGL